ncbi:DUF397 domain-containing protein [Nocardiopsis sp. CNT-189]|uniref:DUF397 domain-containing protein n=1 Tax=Nocardiopsis oceanisediminis TaxID=2816862 RepID=UPI003B385A3F
MAKQDDLRRDPGSPSGGCTAYDGLARTWGGWRKSSHSRQGGDCVLIRPVLGGGLAIRDSKTPDQRPLDFPTRSWLAFLSIALGEEA